MRAVLLFHLLIITLCNRFGRSDTQTNSGKTSDEATFGTNTNIKAKSTNSLGQREYYIPSYSNPQQSQRPQQLIYPQNSWNSYQYSQHKYPNRVPDIVNHRQWAPTPLYRHSVNTDYRYNKPTIDERDVDSVIADYNKEPANEFQYERQQNLNLKQNNVKNSKQKFRATDNVKNKVKDFDAEQERLSKVNSIIINKNDNKMNDYMFAPVMRRKTATNDNLLHTSALQESQRRSIPVPSARQQDSIDSNAGGLGDIYFVALVACVSSVAIFGVIGAGVCVYKVQQSNKAAADVDYPAYGVVGPVSKEVNASGNLSPSGDRKLAQSAQMYHYHHQKQQMIASEKAVTNRRNSASDVESDEDNEEGEYTVYECPGLAPTGEMEVKNPLFHDDITPVSSPPVVGNNTKEK